MEIWWWSGWWFGTWPLFFPSYWEVHPNWLSLHHFSEGLVETTNQSMFFFVLCFLIGSMIMSHWIWGLPDFQALPSHQVTFLAAKWCPKMLCRCAICRAKNVDVSITNPVVKPSCKLTLIVLLITTFQVWQFTTKVLWIMNQPFQVSVTLISPIFLSKILAPTRSKSLGPALHRVPPHVAHRLRGLGALCETKKRQVVTGSNQVLYNTYLYIYIFIYIYL